MIEPTLVLPTIDSHSLISIPTLFSTIEHHPLKNQYHSIIEDKNNVCIPHAPYEMLDEWHRMLFGSSIFVTAIITFMLNLFVIITLVINRHCFQEKINTIRQNSLSTSNSITTVTGNGMKRKFSEEPLTPHSDHNYRLHNRQYREPSCARYSHTHQSFISLSISVIIYSSICVPAMYLETIDQIPTSSNSFIIKILKFGFYVAPIASSFMHLLMAFDRYLAIKQCLCFHTYWYRRHYTFCIVLLWIISVLIVIPFHWYNQYHTTVQILLTLFRLMFTFSIPSLLTLALYVSIACELDRVRKETKIVIQNNKLIVKHRNIIAKIIILASTHFLCWFPFSVVESLNDLFPDLFHQCDSHVQTYYCLMAILILITSMSGIAYPILYCFVSKEFRKIFRCKLAIISLFKYKK